MLWSVVVPAKAPALGKSRLHPDDDGRLAAAMLSDTLHAVVAATSVRRLVVVTSSAEVEALAASVAAAGGVEVVVVADAGGGLNAAIAAGLQQVEAGPWAVLLGDLPALTASVLDRALQLAEGVPFGFVADADGTGTVLLTGRDARPAPQFGDGSAARHLAGGHVALEVPAASALRRDVDTPADLAAAVALGVGPATRTALSGS